MAKPKKDTNEFTTISVRKVDKVRLRALAQFIKKTKSGELYESDAVVFNRIISRATEGMVVNPHDTYPSKKTLSSQGEHQQDSSREGPRRPSPHNT